MSRVELPDGAWCELADPVQVLHRKRKPVRRAMFKIAQRRAEQTDVIGEEELDLLEALNDLIVVALVTSWSFDAEVTVGALGDLPGDVYDALQLACAPLSGALLPT